MYLCISFGSMCLSCNIMTRPLCRSKSVHIWMHIPIFVEVSRELAIHYNRIHVEYGIFFLNRFWWYSKRSQCQRHLFNLTTMNKRTNEHAILTQRCCLVNAESYEYVLCNVWLNRKLNSTFSNCFFSLPDWCLLRDRRSLSTHRCRASQDRIKRPFFDVRTTSTVLWWMISIHWYRALSPVFVNLSQFLFQIQLHIFHIRIGESLVMSDIKRWTLNF